MKIAGADVCKASIVVCILDTIPSNLKEFLRNNQFETYPATREGIEAFLGQEWDAICLEPTGVNYSRLWAYHAALTKREVLWVPHPAIANYRKSQHLPGKNDAADAIALACYGLANYGKREFFLEFDPLATQIRELYLDLEKINKNKQAPLTQLKQRLAHEWPEVVETRCERGWLEKDPPAIWRYLAGEPTRKRYYPDDGIGTGLSYFTLGLAKELCNWERLEYEVELRVDACLSSPEFDPYHRVFDPFDLSPRTKAVILGRIYPFEKFLKDGKPIIERVYGPNSDKRTKRRRSLAAFKLSLGMALIECSSGKSTQWKPGGPKYCRTALWRQVDQSIVMMKRNPAGLKDYYDSLKTKGVPYDKRVMSCCVKLTEAIYRDLVKTFC